MTPSTLAWSPTEITALLADLRSTADSPVGDHLTDAELYSYAAEMLFPELVNKFDTHFDSCPICAARLETWLASIECPTHDSSALSEPLTFSDTPVPTFFPESKLPLRGFKFPSFTDLNSDFDPYELYEEGASLMPYFSALKTLKLQAASPRISSPCSDLKNAEEQAPQHEIAIIAQSAGTYTIPVCLVEHSIDTIITVRDALLVDPGIDLDVAYFFPREALDKLQHRLISKNYSVVLFDLTPGFTTSSNLRYEMARNIFEMLERLHRPLFPIIITADSDHEYSIIEKGRIGQSIVSRITANDLTKLPLYIREAHAQWLNTLHYCLNNEGADERLRIRSIAQFAHDSKSSLQPIYDAVDYVKAGDEGNNQLFFDEFRKKIIDAFEIAVALENAYLIDKPYSLNRINRREITDADFLDGEALIRRSLSLFREYIEAVTNPVFTVPRSSRRGTMLPARVKANLLSALHRSSLRGKGMDRIRSMGCPETELPLDIFNHLDQSAACAYIEGPALATRRLIPSSIRLLSSFYTKDKNRPSNDSYLEFCSLLKARVAFLERGVSADNLLYNSKTKEPPPSLTRTSDFIFQPFRTTGSTSRRAVIASESLGLPSISVCLIHDDSHVINRVRRALHDESGISLTIKRIEAEVEIDFLSKVIVKNQYHVLLVGLWLPSRTYDENGRWKETCDLLLQLKRRNSIAVPIIITTSPSDIDLLAELCRKVDFLAVAGSSRLWKALPQYIRVADSYWIGKSREMQRRRLVANWKCVSSKSTQGFFDLKESLALIMDYAIALPVSENEGAGGLTDYFKERIESVSQTSSVDTARDEIFDVRHRWIEWIDLFGQIERIIRLMDRTFGGVASLLFSSDFQGCVFVPDLFLKRTVARLVKSTFSSMQSQGFGKSQGRLEVSSSWRSGYLVIMLRENLGTPNSQLMLLSRLFGEVDSRKIINGKKPAVEISMQRNDIGGTDITLKLVARSVVYLEEEETQIRRRTSQSGGAETQPRIPLSREDESDECRSSAGTTVKPPS